MGVTNVDETTGMATRSFQRRDLVRLAAGTVVGGAGMAFLAACGAAAPKAASGTGTKSSGSAKSSGTSSSGKSTTSSTSSKAGQGWVPAATNPLAALTAPQAKTPPTIKGKLDSTWSTAQKYSLSPTSTLVQGVGSTFKPTSNPPIKSDDVYLLWDKQNLYVLENRVNTSAGLPITGTSNYTQMYLSNSLGVFFSNSQLSQAAYTIPGHYTVWGEPRGPSGDTKPHIWLRAGGNGKEVDTFPTWPIAATINSTGYVMTMAIPWSALQAVPFTVEKGARIAFTLLATADGPSGKPWGQIMLVGNGDQPTTWGVLTLA